MLAPDSIAGGIDALATDALWKEAVALAKSKK